MSAGAAPTKSRKRPRAQADRSSESHLVVPSVEPSDKRINWMAVALMVLVLLSLWQVDYLPTHDGPQHIFLGHLENHFDDASAGYAHYLERGQPVTSLGFHLVFSTLEGGLGWRFALSVTLSLMLLMWSSGIWMLTRATHPARACVGLVGFGAAFHWAVYMGFFSFVFGMGLCFMTLAFAVRHDPWQLLHRIVIGVLVLISAVCHLYAAMLLGAMLIAVVVSRSSRRTWIKELIWLALMGLPTMLLGAYVLLSGKGDALGAKEDLSFLEQLVLTPAMLLGGPWWRTLPLVVLSLLGAATGVMRWRRGDLEPIERAWVVGAVGLWILAVAAPYHLEGWEFFSPRVLPLAFALGLALVPVERMSAQWRLRMPAAMFAIALIGLGWSAWYNRHLRALADDALSGLDGQDHRIGPRLSVVLDPNLGEAESLSERTVPAASPIYNLGQLYTTEQGGIPSYLFGSRPSLHPFLFHAEGHKLYPPVHDPIAAHDPKLLNDPVAREQFVSWIAALGTRYTDLILYGEPRDVDVLIQRGYVADHRQGGLFLGQFRGCPVTISIPQLAPTRHPLVVEYGWLPRSEPANAYFIPAGEPLKDGAYVLTPTAALCGPTWYRVALDLDASNAMSPGDAVCAGAETDGRVLVSPTEAPTVLTCRLPPTQ